MILNRWFTTWDAHPSSYPAAVQDNDFSSFEIIVARWHETVERSSRDTQTSSSSGGDETWHSRMAQRCLSGAQWYWTSLSILYPLWTLWLKPTVKLQTLVMHTNGSTKGLRRSGFRLHPPGTLRSAERGTGRGSRGLWSLRAPNVPMTRAAPKRAPLVGTTSTWLATLW